MHIPLIEEFGLDYWVYWYKVKENEILQSFAVCWVSTAYMIVDLSKKTLGVGKMSGDDNSLDGAGSVASVRFFYFIK